MFLAEVTDGNNDGSGYTLTEEWPPAKHLNKYLQYKIIECEIKYK